MSSDFFDDDDAGSSRFNHDDDDTKHVVLKASATDLPWPKIAVQSAGIVEASEGRNPEFEFVAKFHRDMHKNIDTMSEIITAVVNGSITLKEGATFGGSGKIPRRCLVKMNGDRARIIVADNNGDLDPETMDPLYRYQFDLEAMILIDPAPEEHTPAGILKHILGAKAEGSDSRGIFERIMEEMTKPENAGRVDTSKEAVSFVMQARGQFSTDELVPLLLSIMMAQSISIKKLSKLVADVFPAKHEKIMRDSAIDMEFINDFKELFASMAATFKKS